jgi:hypothetical protein
MRDRVSAFVKNILASVPGRVGVGLAVILAVEAGVIFIFNNGVFCYSLDDPYIHLRLAQNIARGSYGFNPGEPSSPASSILWPFLLAVFAAFRMEHFAPLLINTLAAFGSITVIWIIQRAALGDPATPVQQWKHTLFLSSLVLSVNLVGLVFIGMEHSLQVLCTLMVIAGLIHEQKTERISAWLAIGLIAGPLLRYENILLTMPALLYLMDRGHLRAALLLGTACAIPMAGFSAYLYSQGLGFLPASILAKSSVIGAGGAADFADRFLRSFQHRESALLAVGVLLLVGPIFSERKRDAEVLFCAIVGLAGALHILVGDYGWFARYEVYIWAAVLLALLYRFRAPIGQWMDGIPLASLAAVLTLGVFLLCPTYLTALLNTPRSAQNIYLQQYQMHRLAVDYLREPVGANDLGWMAYGNDDYVLDMIGLSFPGLARTSYRAVPAEWLNQMVREKGIRAVMIYDDWVPDRPPAWTLAAKLRLTVPRIFIAGDSVSIYATDPDDLPALRSALLRFSETLPAGAILDWIP